MSVCCNSVHYLFNAYHKSDPRLCANTSNAKRFATMQSCKRAGICVRKSNRTNCIAESVVRDACCGGGTPV